MKIMFRFTARWLELSFIFDTFDTIAIHLRGLRALE